MIVKFTTLVTTVVLLCPTVLHARTQQYSFYSDRPEAFLGVIDRYKNRQHDFVKNEDNFVRAGIITHHLLASGLMAEFFESLAAYPAPERIILIGPDHFNKGLWPITTSSLPWKTPFGELLADRRTAKKVRESLHLGNNPEAFSGEHSIGVLVPFIRYYFPKTKIVPIIIQRNVDRNRLISLKTLIGRFLDDPKTLVLLSMDFSHNQTSQEADKHDEVSKKVIEKLEFEKTDELHIDCHPGLKVLLRALAEHGGVRVDFLNHSNSARLSGNLDQKNATSYFTIFFESTPKKQATELSFH